MLKITEDILIDRVNFLKLIKRDNNISMMVG